VLGPLWHRAASIGRPSRHHGCLPIRPGHLGGARLSRKAPTPRTTQGFFISPPCKRGLRRALVEKTGPEGVSARLRSHLPRQTGAVPGAQGRVAHARPATSPPRSSPATRGVFQQGPRFAPIRARVSTTSDPAALIRIVATRKDQAIMDDQPRSFQAGHAGGLTSWDKKSPTSGEHSLRQAKGRRQRPMRSRPVSSIMPNQCVGYQWPPFEAPSFAKAQAAGVRRRSGAAPAWPAPLWRRRETVVSSQSP